MIKSYKVRLFPTKEQEELIWKHINGCRFIYNWGLAYRIHAYDSEGISVSQYELSNMLTQLKKQDEYTWLKEIASDSLQRSLGDLEAAYQNFFRRVKQGKKPGFPKFKSKRKAKPAYPLGFHVIFNESTVRLPKLGEVKYRTNYTLPWGKGNKFTNPRISYVNNKWILTVGIECENQTFDLTDKAMGIDLGVKELATVAFDSECIFYKNINKSAEMKKLEKKLKHLQKKVSNKYDTNGSFQKTQNILKVEKQIAELYFHISNKRKDYTHKVTSELVNKLPMQVTMEDLNVDGMRRNRHLAKAISDANLSEFIRQMKYKCEWKSIPFYQVDRFYPSSKTCSCCGCIKSDLKLSDRIFICNDCGLEIDRDYNAAINLRNYMNFTN